jgi:cytochrome c oxidase subunit IV
MENDVEDIHRQVRVYISVFAALAALTVITVGISYLHLATPAAVTFAMLVAVVKGSLVGLYFMHLIHEKRAVYGLLGLTVIFFVAVMYLPGSWMSNDMRTHAVWDKLPQEGRMPVHATAQAAGEQHGNASSPEEHASPASADEHPGDDGHGAAYH